MDFTDQKTVLLKLPHVFGSGMVLQRNAPAKIWGLTKAKSEVAVRFAERTLRGEADSDGRWKIILPEMDAGGPYTMEIESAGEKVTFGDVLFGDVWLCAGQSNMQLPIERVKDNYPAVLKKCENPFIRQFIVPMKYDFNHPRFDIDEGIWEKVNPDTVCRFTAAGYFFAEELYKSYKIPIGLINTAIGGTPVQAWLSEDALRNFPDYMAEVKKYQDGRVIESVGEHDKQISEAWFRHLDKEDKGLAQSPCWYDENYDASGWKTMNLPSSMEEMGLDRFNGAVWIRKEINLPEEFAGKPARLIMGRIVDSDVFYVNGKFAGTTTYQYPPRKYDIPSGMLKPGKNILAGRVISNHGKGEFVKGKPYQIICGRRIFNLEGEWKYRIGATAQEPLQEQTFFQYKPVGLFNGMIAPIINYSIKGVIWYQGESNTGKPDDYQALFSALIDDWREKWKNKALPFLYVQLPNYKEEKEIANNWPLIREAQLKTLAKPYTAMAVTVDIGEWNDLHPLGKSDVGSRLALAARKVAYGENNVVYMGPIYESMSLEKNRIRLSFSNVGTGLIVKGGGQLNQFEIRGRNGGFIQAQAKIENNQVVVWNDSVKNPVAVRYAWADNPAGANLYNKEGLPASPFRAGSF